MVYCSPPLNFFPAESQIDQMKKFGARLVFLTKISPAIREMPEWKPGLTENITENMIDIWLFYWQGIFSNTYYPKRAFQTALGGKGGGAPSELSLHDNF